VNKDFIGVCLLRLKIKNELIPLNLLVVVLVVVIIFFPSNVARIILGLPFLLFFPGYTLLAALFPSNKGMSGIERVALSCGLSIAIVPLMGLILNSTPLGISLEVILSFVASFIVITSIIAYLRRRRLPEPERFSIRFQSEAPGRRGGVWDKVLTVVLVIAIFGALGSIGYIIVTSDKGEESPTTFYILGLEGRAENYPQELALGDKGRVILGILNQEHETTVYWAEVTIDEEKVTEVGPITLDHEQKWEEEVSFVPQVSGENQRVEFLLYKNGEVKPYLEPLHLWIDVTK